MVAVCTHTHTPTPYCINAMRWAKDGPSSHPPPIQNSPDTPPPLQGSIIEASTIKPKKREKQVRGALYRWRTGAEAIPHPPHHIHATESLCLCADSHHFVEVYGAWQANSVCQAWFYSHAELTDTCLEGLSSGTIFIVLGYISKIKGLLKSVLHFLKYERFPKQN